MSHIRRGSSPYCRERGSLGVSRVCFGCMAWPCWPGVPLERAAHVPTAYPAACKAHGLCVSYRNFSCMSRGDCPHRLQGVPVLQPPGSVRTTFRLPRTVLHLARSAIFTPLPPGTPHCELLRAHVSALALSTCALSASRGAFALASCLSFASLSPRLLCAVPGAASLRRSHNWRHATGTLPGSRPLGLHPTSAVSPHVPALPDQAATAYGAQRHRWPLVSHRRNRPRTVAISGIYPPPRRVFRPVLCQFRPRTPPLALLGHDSVPLLSALPHGESRTKSDRFPHHF